MIVGILFRIVYSTDTDSTEHEADRFVMPPQTIHTWAELLALRPADKGKCWVHIPVCMVNPSYSGMGDEFDEAYNDLGVGDSESICLARAQYHWEMCGSNPFHQVIMTFLPSGASVSFPDDLTVERHLDSKHGFFRLAKWMGTDKVCRPGRLHAPALLGIVVDRCISPSITSPFQGSRTPPTSSFLLTSGRANTLLLPRLRQVPHPAPQCAGESRHRRRRRPPLMHGTVAVHGRKQERRVARRPILSPFPTSIAPPQPPREL